MHADSAHRQQIECPRCGFVVDTAIHAAKARGESVVICTECGLDSDIALLESESACPPWLIESRVGRHRVVSRFFRTLGRSLAPHRFWRAVRIEAPVSPRGLVAYLVCIAIALHVLAFASVAPAIVVENRTRGTSSLPDLAFAAVLPLCPALGTSIMQAAREGSPDGSVDSGAIARFVLAALRVTVERNRVTRLDPVPRPLGGGDRPDERTPPWAMTVPVIKINHGLTAQQQAMLAPLGVASLAVVSSALFALLPASLRRAKVRKSHLVRAAVYAAGLLPVMLALHACGSLVLASGGQLGLMPVGVAQWIALPVLGVGLYWSPIFAILWLHAVCKRYLRLPRAWLVTLLFTIVLALILLCLVAVANGGSL